MAASKARHTQALGYKASAALLTPWLIWKQWSERIFEGAHPSVQNLVARIKDEAALWARAGAKGLPSTWDVH